MTAPGPTYSPDGQWVWDGARWQPILSPDGVWRWNGTAWARYEPPVQVKPPVRRGVIVALVAGIGGPLIALSILVTLVVASINSVVPNMAQQNRVDVHSLVMPFPVQAIESGRNSVLLLSEEASTLTLVNASGAIRGEVGVGQEPVAMIDTGDPPEVSGGRVGDVWTANMGDGTVTRVRSDLHGSPTTVAVGGHPVALDATYDSKGNTKNVVVATQGPASIVVINAKSNHVERRIALRHPPTSVLVEPRFYLVESAPDGVVSCVSRSGGRTIDVSIPGLLPSMVSGSNPANHAVALLAPASSAVVLVDTQTCAAETAPVGNTPVSLITDGVDYYVLNEGSGTVTDINPGNPAQPRTFDVGGHPTAFTVELKSGIWIGYRDGTVVRTGQGGGAGIPRRVFRVGFAPNIMDGSLVNSVWVVGPDARATLFDLNYWLE